MKILTKENIIVAISEKAEIVPNGIELDNFILGVSIGEDGRFTEELPKIHEVKEVPKGIKPQEYCFDGTNFTLNQKYIAPYEPQAEIKDLQTKIILMQKALDDVLLGGAI